MNKANRLSLLLAAAGLLVLFGYLTGPGLGGTGDSRHYLGTALHLRQTGQLTDVDGLPYRFWGPLYPGLLALCYAPWAVRLLHGAALLGSLVLWSRLGEKLLPPGRAQWLPPLLALSTAVLVPAKFVWAETVFGLLAAGYFVSLLAWLRSGHGGWLGLATALGFLLPLQRTSGFFLLAGAAAGLLATGATRGRWRPLALHGLLGAAGGLAWNYYAEVSSGPPVYQHVYGLAKLGNSVADYGFVLGRWFVPLATGWRAQWPLLWAVGLPGLLALLWPLAGWERGGAGRSFAPGAAPVPLFGSGAALRLLWWVLVVDLLAHFVAVNLHRGAAGLHDAERYLAALAGPVLLLGLARWPAAAGWRRLGGGLLAAWLAYSAGRIAHNAYRLRARPPVAWPPEPAGAVRKTPPPALRKVSQAVVRPALTATTSPPDSMKQVFFLALAAVLGSAARPVAAQTTTIGGPGGSIVTDQHGTTVQGAGGTVTTTRTRVKKRIQGAGTATVTSGNAVSISGNNSSRTVACDGNAVTVLGNNNNVRLTGTCARLTVAGNNNRVAAATLGSASTSGNHNAVTWTGPKPAVSDLGTGNSLKEQGQ